MRTGNLRVFRQGSHSPGHTTGATRQAAERDKAEKAIHVQWVRARRAVRHLVLLLCLTAWGSARSAAATQLKPATLDAFQHYVSLTETRMASEIHGPNAFLWVDQLPPQRRQAALEQLRQGQVITERLETREKGQPIPIPSGMVHHWVASVFVPGVDLLRTIAEQKNFDRSAQIYGPDIQRSKLLQADGNDFRVYYRIHRHVMVESPTYNANFDVQFYPIDGQREYSRSYSTRIAELIDAGLPGEREKPVGEDLGYLWRLNTYTRYEARDGGVYIQTEFIALSRSVPAIFAWLVDPYIRSIPQDYLTHILGATREDLMSSRQASARGTMNGQELSAQPRPVPPGVPPVSAGATHKGY